MSQYPPPQYPPQYPPPPPIQYGQYPTPQGSNAWAITSLVCGIIGCLVITPFVAIVTGLIGLGKARLQGGRGMAVTGIILGILWIVGAVVIGGGTYFYAKKLVAQGKAATIDTINALVDGDLVKAQRYAKFTPAELQAASQQLASYGHCTDLSISGFNSYKNAVGPDSLAISGVATFDKAGKKNFSANLLGDNTGLHVQNLKIDP